MPFQTEIATSNLRVDRSIGEVIDYLNQPQKFLQFSESLRRLIAIEYPELDQELWNRDVIKLLFEKLDTAGIEYHPDTVRHWVNRDIRPGEELAIGLCYSFDCFCGEPDEANIFLMKDCRLDGFSPREPKHIIFRYGLANSYTWQEVSVMQESFSNRINGLDPKGSTGKESEDTGVLIDVFMSEEGTRKNEELFLNDLVEYFANDRFGRYRKTALEQYKDLLIALYTALDEDYDIDENGPPPIPYTELLDRFWPRPRTGEEGDPVKHKDMTLPKELTRNIPSEPELPKMARGEAVINRKTLILAHFATRWLLTDEPNKSPEQRLDSFQTRTNEILKQCGMTELYPGNHFDWAIMKSALTARPNDFFADLLEYAASGESA